MFMKYAYIKYGDVVDELEKVGPSPTKVPLSGPLTFISGFLRMVGDNPALLISWTRNDWNSRSEVGHIQAYAYKRPKSLLKFATAFRMFGQLIRFRPDIVLCVHDGPGLWAAFLVCRLLGTALLHSRQRAIKVAGDSWRRRASAKIDGFVIRHAKGVICHGPFTRHQLIEIGVSASRIIEFDVRFDEFISSQTSASGVSGAQPDTDRRKILFLGRMEASKGIFELLEASIPLLKARSDVDLCFVGQGAALQHLQQRVSNEGMDSRIFFTGPLPHNQVSAQLRSATLLAAPTRRGLEGWPMAALEGLAMGVPVVAPDAGPFPFMIEDGFNGLLYTDGQIADLRKKIESILDDPGLRDKLAIGAEKTAAARAETVKDFGTALDRACSLFCS
jgi:glycosyltransferase involved in cell wall biosynthesis